MNVVRFSALMLAGAMALGSACIAPASAADFGTPPAAPTLWLCHVVTDEAAHGGTLIVQADSHAHAIKRAQSWAEPLGLKVVDCRRIDD